MSERPTPEDIIGEGIFDSMTEPIGGEEIRGRLAEQGYVIVHPDDVPYRENFIGDQFDKGWDACRDHRRPWGSGTIKPIISHGKTIGYQVRWSLGVDPFTGKQVRKAESHHGITKADAQHILNQRLADKHETITCPKCGAKFPHD